MPVTFDNIGTSFSSGAGVSIAFNFTAAANTVLLVWTHCDGDRSCSAVAYGGVACTQLLDQTGGGAQLWALTAPAAGINVLSATWRATGAIAFRAIAVTYLGVKAVGGFGTVQGTVSSGANCGLSLSSSTTDLVAYFCKNNGAALSAAPGTSRLSGSTSTSCKFVVADTAGLPSTSVSVSTGAGSAIKILGIPLVFSAAATTSPWGLATMGCGL